MGLGMPKMHNRPLSRPAANRVVEFRIIGSSASSNGWSATDGNPEAAVPRFRRATNPCRVRGPNRGPNRGHDRGHDRARVGPPPS